MYRNTIPVVKTLASYLVLIRTNMNAKTPATIVEMIKPRLVPHYPNQSNSNPESTNPAEYKIKVNVIRLIDAHLLPYPAEVTNLSLIK